MQKNEERKVGNRAERTQKINKKAKKNQKIQVLFIL